MTGWLLFFSSAGAGIVRSAACLFLISCLLGCQKPGWKSLLAGGAGSAGCVLLILAAELPGYSGILLETLLIVACAVRFLKADLRMSLFLSIFYQIAVSFWQFLIAAWLGVLFHCAAFLRPETVNGQIAVWLLHLLLAALAGYLWRDAVQFPKSQAFRFASVIVLAGFLAVITLSEQTALRIADDTLDMWTLLSVVLMMSILVFHINRQYEAEKELAKLKSDQAKLLEHDYMALNRAYAVNAKLFHDFHNHIGVLRQLLSHGKANEAVQYLDELQAPVQEMTDTIWTGEETVDYLINSKSAAARQCGIAYQVQVEFPRHTNLQSADLCAVLGNLLDNALEAAKQVPVPKQRFVRLTIRRIHQMLVIKVENSYAAAPAVQDGALKTSKEPNGLHGWGLKSAQTAAEKYDGMIQTSYSSGTFQAVATLSFQGVAVP